MKTPVLIVAALLLASTAGAQRQKLAAVNAETEEGKALQAIGQEADSAKKIALMEQFMAAHGKHEAAGWVLSQMQAEYAKTGNHDKAIEAGEKLFAMDPLDVAAAYGNLKAAEAKKDADAVIKWSAATSEAARKMAQSPKAADQAEEDHKKEVDYAKQVDTYTEYALYATALGEPDPQKVMQLADALEQRNPNSQYIAMVMSKYAAAARQAKALPAAVAYGERAFGRGQYNEDLLLAMAEHYMQQKQPDKVVLYASKVPEVMERPKPEGISDEDWQKKKNTTVGVAYWMAGITLSDQKKYAEADKSLRAALPLVKDNAQLALPALFHLGVVNYRLAQASKSKSRIADAVSYSKQAAAYKGPLAAQAAKNVKVMQQEFGVR